MAEWYYAQGNTQRGPVAADVVIDALRSGSLSAGDLVWCEGMPQWKPAGEVPEFAAAIASAPPVQPVAPMAYAMPASALPPVGSVAYSQPYYPAPPAQHLGLSITSMVLGIVSFCCCSAGVLTAIPALILGLIVLTGMKRSGDTRGKGMAITGVVLGSVYLALFTLVIIMAVLHPGGHSTTYFRSFRSTTPPQPWPTHP
jgi:hypothetical protein